MQSFAGSSQIRVFQFHSFPEESPLCSTKTSVAIRKKKMAGAEDASHS